MNNFGEKTTNEKLLSKMKAFQKAAFELTATIYSQLNDEDMSDAFAKNYPFEKSFDEINRDISDWVEKFKEEAK